MASGRLVVRPMPFTDESLAGYLLRLTEENLCRSPTWIVEQCSDHGRGWRDPTAVDLGNLISLEKLMVATGHSREVLCPLFPHRAPEDEKGRRQFFGHRLPSELLRYHPSRVCPDCLREAPYLRNMWAMAFVTACHRHGHLLVERCPSCKKVLSWKRAKVAHCVCGYDLRRMLPVAVEPEEARLSQQLHALCGLEPDVLGEAKASSPLSSLDFEGLVATVQFFARYMDPARPATGGPLRISRPLEDLHRLVVGAYRILHDWPNGYHRFLDGLLASGADSVAPRPVSEVGSFRDALYDALGSGSTAFAVTAFEDYHMERWGGGYVDPRCRLADVEMLSRCTRVTVAEGARRAGMSQNQLRRLMEQGRLPYTSRQAERNTWAFLEVQALGALQEHFSRALSLSAVMERLGVGRPAVTNLVDAGLLRLVRGPDVDGHPSRTFDGESVNKLLAAIAARVKPSEGEMIGLLGAVRMLGRTRWAGTAAVIQAVLKGELEPVACDEAQGLGGLRFLVGGLQQAMAADRVQALPGYTLTEAARRLGVKEEVVRFLAKRGVLEGGKANRGGREVWHVTEPALRSFRKTYMFARDLARRQNTSPRAITEQLMGKGIHPVSGPSVDGGRQYVFRRRDIPYRAYRAQRRPTRLLTFGEAAAYLGLTTGQVRYRLRTGEILPHKGKGAEVSKQVRFSLFELNRFKKRS